MKKTLSFLLSLVMALTLWPAAALADQSAGEIVMSFEYYDAEEETVALLRGPEAVAFTDEDTGLTLARTLLGEENVNAPGGWLTGLTVDEVEYSAASLELPYGSWAVYRNNAEDAVGIGDYRPQDGDVYRVVLTSYDPKTYRFPAMPRDLDALYWAMAESGAPLEEANALVQGETPAQSEIDDMTSALSGGGAHRVLIDGRTVQVDASSYPYTYTPTLTADKSLAAAGETVTVTVTEPVGLRLADLRAGGAALEAGEEEGTYTFSMPDCPVAVTAAFEEAETAANKLLGAVFSYDAEGEDPIPLTPAFDPAVREYDLTLYDCRLDDAVYSTLTFDADAGTTASWQYYLYDADYDFGFYTPGPDAAATRSGEAYGHAAANLTAPGMTNGQQHRVDVRPAGGSAVSYYFRTTLLPTLAELTVDGGAVEGFDPERAAYTVTVPEGTASVTVNAVPYDEEYSVYLNGAVEDIASAPTVLALTDGEALAELTVDDGYGVTAAYTLRVREAKSPAAQERLDRLDTLLDTIAAGYTESSGEWVVMDMAAYSALRPEGPKTSAAARQTYLNSAVAAVAEGGWSPAQTYAKAAIILRAVGADPTHLTRADGETVLDVTALLRRETVESVYVAPWVLLANVQGDLALTEEQVESLLAVVLREQGDDGLCGYEWDGVFYADLDTTGTVLAALAPYCDGHPAAKAAADRAVAALSAHQGENGSFGSANTDAMLLIGLAALGIDPDTDSRFLRPGGSLLDGLLSYALRDDSGFGFTDNTSANDLATEQGFRALLTARQVLETGEAYQVYDFSAVPAEAAGESAFLGCPVTLSVIPQGAEVSVTRDGAAMTAEGGVYDLAAGTYAYTAAKDGYRTASGTFTVTEEEASSHSAKRVSVSLTAVPDSGSSQIRVQVRVLTHDGTACGGQLTYKHDASAYYALAEDSVTLRTGQSAFDAVVTLLEREGLSYEEKTYGYLSAIDGLGETDHGSSNSGWLYMVNGRVTTTGSRDRILRNGDEVIFFFTDNYVDDYGSEKWTSGSSGASSAAPATERPAFSDVPASSPFYAAVQWAAGTGVTTGTSATLFSPNAPCTRAQAVTLLHRAVGAPAPAGTVAPFADVDPSSPFYTAIQWAAEQGIALGTEGLFRPDETVTRAQAAAFLYRAAGSPAARGAAFTDVAPGAYYRAAVDWAAERGVTLGTTAATFSPNAPCTRAQLVTFLYRRYAD